jgi:hypothetical protein
VQVDITKLSESELMEMLVVPEDLVQLCSETMMTEYGDEGVDNNFEVVLKQGSVLKKAGRTPVYLCTQDMKVIYVTSMEKISKNYH